MKTLSLSKLILDPTVFEVMIPDRMMWTASSLKLFRACKRKFFWKYMMRIRSKFKDRNLLIGSAFHHCLGEWYRGKRSSIASIASAKMVELQKDAQTARAYYDQDDLDKLNIAIDTFQGMMIAYGELYKKDRDIWDIQRESIEKPFVVKYQDFDLLGKTDLVAGQPGKSRRQFLVEHKTASMIKESYIDRLALDTQVRCYIVGATKGLGYTINEVVYDVVKKCKLRKKSNEDATEFGRRIAGDYLSDPSKYFYREKLLFSTHDIAAFEYELHQTHREYENIIFPLMGNKSATSIKVFEEAFVTGGKNRPAEDPRMWLPNDQNCDAYFRTCEYHKLCTVGLDRGTAMVFTQSKNLHDELAEEETGD